MTVGLAAVIPLVLAVHGGQVQGMTAIWSLALPVMTLAVTGFAFLTPSVQSLISRRSDPARQGDVLGGEPSAPAPGRILGPLVGPTLFFADATHAWPYVFGAGLMSVVCGLTFRVSKEA